MLEVLAKRPEVTEFLRDHVPRPSDDDTERAEAQQGVLGDHSRESACKAGVKADAGGCRAAPTRLDDRSRSARAGRGA